MTLPPSTDAGPCSRPDYVIRTVTHIRLSPARTMVEGRHAPVDDVVNGRLLILGARVRDTEDQPQKGSDAWAYPVVRRAPSENVDPSLEGLAADQDDGGHFARGA